MPSTRRRGARGKGEAAWRVLVQQTFTPQQASPLPRQHIHLPHSHTERACKSPTLWMHAEKSIDALGLESRSHGCC